MQYTRLAELGTSGQRWLRTSYEPDRDADGEVLGLYTVSIDVHEMTLVQERLRRRVERDALTRVSAGGPSSSTSTLRCPPRPKHRWRCSSSTWTASRKSTTRSATAEGDRLLAAVAAALQGALRAEDCVGRFGGDEFIVLARVHDRAGAHALAVHLLQAVQLCNAGIAGSQAVSASIGYALSPADADQTRQLIQRADEAMYRAKRQGRRHRATHCNDEAR